MIVLRILILAAAMSDDGTVRDGAADGSRDTEETAEAPADQTSDVSASGNESSHKEEYTVENDADPPYLSSKIFAAVDGHGYRVLGFLSPEAKEDMLSYINCEIKSFFKATPASPTASYADGVKTIVEVNYYTWLRSFLSKKSLTERTFAHGMREDNFHAEFLSVIPPQTLSDESLMNEAFANCARMKESAIPSFEAALWKQWTPVEQVFSVLDDNDNTGGDIEDAFMKFLESTYFATMKQCIEQHENNLCKFKLPVPIDHDASLETQALRKHLL